MFSSSFISFVIQFVVALATQDFNEDKVFSKCPIQDTVKKYFQDYHNIFFFCQINLNNFFSGANLLF